MAPRGGEARLVEDLRDLLDDFAFRAKRLAAPLLQPFGPFSEPGCIDDEELNKLKSKLKRIRATLRAAEDRVVADDFVRLWLRELRDLEHAAEDVLEELEFEALRSARLEQFKIQLHRSSSGKRKREVRSMFSASANRLKGKIAKIMERYNEIARDRDALRLRSSDGERRQEVNPMTPTSCLMKCRLHGRERDKRQVTELLFSDEANCSGVYSVVPVVGPAGVGKTSLVQHIYNDDTISSKFDIKMWVWLCQEFDVLKLTRKLAEEATESPCGFAEMNQMHRVITNRLKGKRFLLVLDDVWDESRDHWASLQVPLKCAAPGSKIIVTTRSTKVAKMMALKIHQLGYLSDTDCWSVCQDVVLRGRDPSIIDDSLISIGKSVAARCKGLPVAANAVGNVLSSAIDRKHWEAVEQSDLWNSEVVGQILPALAVSYNSLHKHLKRCFSYCSLFPKGYMFRKDKLVRLWLAQDFVEAGKEFHAEDIACKYFDDLVEKFFLQRAPYIEERYTMHDLYHELAEYVSVKEYSRMEEAEFYIVDEDARHLSFAPSEDPNEIVQFYTLHNQYLKELHIPGLRTLLVIQKDEPKDEGNELCIKFPSGLLKHFGSLRALDLSYTDIECLPHSVGELIHLRHLELPSMDNWNVYMPRGIGELTNLQTMHMVRVGSDSGSFGIADLVNLNKLRGELCIAGMENVTSEEISPEASIKSKGELRIQHQQSLSYIGDTEVHKHGLLGAMGQWDEIEATDFPCLHHLTIMRCSKLRGLPKLQALQNLRIKNLNPFLRLKKEPKVSGCEVLPFQNLSVQDSQKTWTFLRCAAPIVECNCNFIGCTDIAFGQTNIQASEVEIAKDVSLYAGHLEPVWIEMAQPEEIEHVCID
ncbi:hypothetical protein ACP70R_011324 [Stipagrostis hirtigluma subsp. patula]